MNRRDSAIVLITIALIVSIFLAIPTMSNPNAGGYDSWLDYNGDGVIDMRDIAPAAAAFMAAGDSTKNVTVVNWPAAPQQTVFFHEEADSQSGLYNASGFSQIHLTWGALNVLIDDDNFTVAILSYITDPSGIAGSIGFRVQTLIMFNANRTGTLSLPVPGETFRFDLIFGPATHNFIYLAFYLTYA